MNIGPAEMGEHLARLVWESFTDFYEDDARLAGSGAEGPWPADEVLILFMWVHTRACQQAFGRRVDEGVLREMLDSLHRSVFEDLEAHGISRATLPLFEQRVSARYATYYSAAEGEPSSVSEMAARHLAGVERPPPSLAAAIAECTAATAGPLRDFLEEVTLERAS